MARWLSWLERRPVTAEVEGSSPFRVAFLIPWDHSSAGRAPALQAGGHRFEPYSGSFFEERKTKDSRLVQWMETAVGDFRKNSKNYGSVVKRSRHRPFTAVTRVRFPSESLSRIPEAAGQENVGRLKRKMSQSEATDTPMWLNWQSS